AIGRELGVHEPQLLELEYAALMHDIGQLSLHDPIPGGATVLVSRQDQQRIAELGADVIQQAQVLGSVAEIVRRQNEPYRDTDHALPSPAFHDREQFWANSTANCSRSWNRRSRRAASGAGH